MYFLVGKLSSDHHSHTPALRVGKILETTCALEHRFPQEQKGHSKEKQVPLELMI